MAPVPVALGYFSLPVDVSDETLYDRYTRLEKLADVYGWDVVAVFVDDPEIPLLGFVSMLDTARTSQPVAVLLSAPGDLSSALRCRIERETGVPVLDPTSPAPIRVADMPTWASVVRGDDRCT